VPSRTPRPIRLRSANHPGRNALIAIATDSTGQITGGQFIHLDRHGHKLAKAEAHARPTAKGRPSSACAGCALTGAACTRLPSRQWYQRTEAVHELADGRLVGAERDHHPDAIASVPGSAIVESLASSDDSP
jgi:hypothetical protein